MARPAPLFNDAQQRPFIEAARRGDLPAVQRYFELPDVRDNVALWNAVDRAERLGDPSPVPSSRHLPRPWHFGTHRDQHLFSSAIVEGGQVELFQWFFAREQLERFGETLRTIVGDTLHGLIFADDYTAAREMAEILFESTLFQEVMDDNERLEVLGKMLNTVVSRGYHWWLGALLGHGADPNLKADYETPLSAIAYQGNSKTLDLLLAHGARMEGDDLLTQRAYNRTEALVGELLHRGADANADVGKHGSALHDAARHCFGTTVWLLIHKGFADVDARDARGRTPLMAVASDIHNYRRGSSSKLRVVARLLDGGASVHAVDDKGYGVLHHMLRGRSAKCLSTCLERGADPNLRDADGRTPMAALLEQTRHDVFGCMAEMFSELLRAGADPFLLDNSGVSAAEMLTSTDTGRAFLEAEAAFFRR